MELRVQNTPLQNQHQLIINHTGQVQHTTRVRVAEALREAIEHLPLLQSQVIAQVLLREVAVAATEAVEAVAEAADLRTQVVRVAQEVQVVRAAAAAAAAVVVQDHLRAEDN